MINPSQSDYDQDQTQAQCGHLCGLPPVKPRELPSSILPERAGLILMNDKKWVNGTVLHYYFLRSPSRLTAAESRQQIVRDAFQMWKDIGIGLEFMEVDSADEAEVRIGFGRGDGHWSYVGRDVLEAAQDERTMNFDKNDDWDINTALHEIGHTLGFPHEHQNPIAGIEWNEEEIYTTLAGPPNFWSREQTFFNIIRKIAPDEVQGSSWDPDSIMHYELDPGFIVEPEKYRDGLIPEPGLSERDITWVKTFYPPIEGLEETRLLPFRSRQLSLTAGEQVNFTVIVDATRKYTMSTFGESDTVMVLFEEVDGDLRYVTGDDDSGSDLNAQFEAKLFAGRRYVLRVRLYYQRRAGDFAVMMW